MEKTQCITVPVSDGDWNFNFELTQKQAFALLNARIGETVKLNGTREQILVQDTDSLSHTQAASNLSHNDGSTSEGLQRKATLSIINQMIADKAWHSDEEA